MSPVAERARASIAPLAQTVDVETPELVTLTYTVAGVGSRTAAALIDYLLAFSALALLVIVLGALGASGLLSRARTSSDAWAIAILVLAQFVVQWGYYVLFEGLADGQTPGKRWLGLRVVRDGGYSVTLGASAVRNLVRVVDMQPAILYAVGLASVAISRTGKRLGDYAAGTIVVREAIVRRPAPSEGARAPESESGALTAALTDDEFQVLERFMDRASSLDDAQRSRLASRLAVRLARPLADLAARAALTGDASRGDVARLRHLLDVERAARARGAVVARASGAARERHAIVAAGSPRWSAFATRLARAQRSGLASLGEEGVRDFVREYRDLAADLARLRTAARGDEREEIFYLSRLMAGAHNLLYRTRSLAVRDVLRALAVDLPAEVVRSWRPIALAAALLFGPAAIAYVAVVRDPATAGVFLPPQMLDRAEEGVRRAQAGTGYIQDPQLFRPVMASQIVAINVQVTFMAFALGITAGIGTVLALVTNGVSFGGVFGLYASKGIARLLLAFVAPHGVLELSAICIAGGGGFLLAAALLIPGARTRRRALAENGRRAIRLLGASTVMLIVAGSLEGFVSPIPSWPFAGKLAVSALTAVALVAWLRHARSKSDSLGRVPPAR